MGARDGSKDFQDFRKHVFESAEHVIVPEAQYAVIIAMKPCITIRIYRLIVLTAIDFNDQASFDTSKVGDERAHRLLLAKMKAAKLFAAQTGP
jgi:hypothetical protein